MVEENEKGLGGEKMLVTALDYHSSLRRGQQWKKAWTHD